MGSDTPCLQDQWAAFRKHFPGTEWDLGVTAEVQPITSVQQRSTGLSLELQCVILILPAVAIAFFCLAASEETPFLGDYSATGFTCKQHFRGMQSAVTTKIAAYLLPVC